jgi:hypothetical protein
VGGGRFLLSWLLSPLTVQFFYQHRAQFLTKSQLGTKLNEGRNAKLYQKATNTNLVRTIRIGGCMDEAKSITKAFSK